MSDQVTAQHAKPEPAPKPTKERKVKAPKQPAPAKPKASKEKASKDKAAKVRKPGVSTYLGKVEKTPGVTTKVKVKASNRSQARISLSAAGHTVLDVTRVAPWYEMEIGGGIPDSQLLQFTRQMAAFTSVGISISTALDMLSRTTKNKSLQRILTSMVQDIEDGDSLASALGGHARSFPPYFQPILAASERSGEISTAFETLADYVERDLASKRAVRSALYYPTVLVVLGIAAIFVLNTVVLPRFQVFFASLNAELPAPTRALMAFSAFMSTWWMQLLAAMLAVALTVAVSGRYDRGRLVIDRFLLKMPIFGGLLDLIALERFNRVLGTLSNAGVPLPDALSLAANVVGNKVYSRAIEATRRGVLNGEGLAGPMAATKVFSEATVQVVLVGEQTGRLSHQLEQSAKMHSKELDYRLKNFAALIEPAVLLLVGGGVGFVAIALVSAMYGIYNSGQLTG